LVAQKQLISQGASGTLSGVATACSVEVATAAQTAATASTFAATAATANCASSGAENRGDEHMEGLVDGGRQLVLPDWMIQAGAKARAEYGTEEALQHAWHQQLQPWQRCNDHADQLQHCQKDMGNVPRRGVTSSDEWASHWSGGDGAWHTSAWHWPRHSYTWS